MKKAVSPPKALSNSTRQRLHTYALAAGAAGVSMLALTQPGEAEIIYHRAHVYSSFSLDMNGDGTVDFNVMLRSSGSSDFMWANGAGVKGNGIMGPYSASVLSSGAQIGPSAKFVSSAFMNAGGHHGTGRTFQWSCFGPWKNVRKRYLGLRFMINGEVHYGWARLNESCHRGFNQALLTGYAYETVANQAIVAGRKKGVLEDEEPTGTSQTPPGTLGHLAMGAQAFRQRRAAQADSVDSSK